MSSLDQLERSKMYKIIIIQMATVLFFSAVCIIFNNLGSFFAVILGGLSSILPSFIFITIMFALFDSQVSKRLAVFFLIGEFVKLLISAFLLSLVVIRMQDHMVSAVVGFFAALLGNWLAPFLINRKGKRSAISDA